MHDDDDDDYYVMASAAMRILRDLPRARAHTQ